MKIIKKVCLTNWHYINHKILEFSEELNFFTGHSGSGKSTVVDALQVVLLGDTYGERFFNKAAGKGSDRKLIEYLRGMQSSTNDKTFYLRNQNFTTHIILEMEDTIKKQNFLLGCVLDVDVATNTYNHLFFYLKDVVIPENEFIENGIPLTISQFKQKYKGKADFTTTNKEYRKKFLNNYMGNLSESFYDILLKSVSFNMDTDLETFIKNFICGELIIDVDEMQEDLRNIKRMEDNLSFLQRETELLEEISTQYNKLDEIVKRKELYDYFIKQSNIDYLSNKILDLEKRENSIIEQKEYIENRLIKEQEEITEIEGKNEDLQFLISKSDIATLEREYAQKIDAVDNQIKSLSQFENMYNKEVAKFNEWRSLLANRQAILNKFSDFSISEEEYDLLVEIINYNYDKLQHTQFKFNEQIKTLNVQKYNLENELADLESGIKEYPRYVVNVKNAIEKGLREKYNKEISVDILADVIEIINDRWRNAIEGYMSSSKLHLLVNPKYFEDALSIYNEIQTKDKHRVSLVDCEKVANSNIRITTNSLRDEIKTTHHYAQKYVDYLLGGVVKCDDVSELRKHNVAITSDCVLYRGFVVRTLNPYDYTQNMMIGNNSMAKILENKRIELDRVTKNLSDVNNQYKSNPCSNLNRLNKPSVDKSELFKWIENIQGIDKLRSQRNELEEKMNSLDLTAVETYKVELEENKTKLKELRESKSTLDRELGKYINLLEKNANDIEISKEEYESEIEDTKKLFSDEWLESKNALSEYDKYKEENNKYSFVELVDRTRNAKTKADKDILNNKNTLIALRNTYCNEIGNFNFEIYSDTNEDFDNRLESIRDDKLGEYKELFEIQREKAYERFANDFLFRIRDGINDAKERIRELNNAISNISFGKNKYKFIIKPSSKEQLRKFYDMFMEEDDTIISTSFFMNIEENKHKDTIEELFNEITYSGDALSESEQKKLKEKIDKYSDYRTYLEFDMEEETSGGAKTELSKTLSKNSGGETQNPLYIALLSSYIQLYRLHRANKEYNQTLRLIIFDEAFNKMDAVKVRICLELIRNLGLQAIIVAPNDKMQNYIEVVNKTFVFHNENKKNIDIASFEQKEILQLMENSNN